jgi:hypothetical protein
MTSGTPHLAGTILTEETVTITVVERDLGRVNEQASVVRESVLFDLDITTLRVGCEDTSG